MNKLTNLIISHDCKFGVSLNGKIPWKYSGFFDPIIKPITNFNKVNALIMNSSTYQNFLNIKLESMCKLYLIKDTRINFSDRRIKLADNMLDAINKCEYDNNIDKIFIYGDTPHILENRYVDKIYLAKIKKDYKCSAFVKDHYSIDTYDNNVFYNTDDLQISEFFRDRFENASESDYQNLLASVIYGGTLKNLNNTDYIVKNDKIITFDLKKGFPLLTTKYQNFKQIVNDFIELFMAEISAKNLIDGLNLKLAQTLFFDNKFNSFSSQSISQLFVSKYNDINNQYLNCHVHQTSVNIFHELPIIIAWYALLINLICVSSKIILKPGNLTISIREPYVLLKDRLLVEDQILRCPLNFPELNILSPLENFNLIDIFLELTVGNNAIDSLKPEYFSVKNYLSYSN